MKKRLLTAIVAVIILAIALTAVLAACKDDPGATSEEAQAQRQQSIFALAAVSAGELIGGSEAEQAALADGSTVEIAAELDEYMAMLDSIIGGDRPITSTVGANTNEQYSQYDMVQTITAETVGGAAETYTLYYNETHQPNYGDDDDDRDEREDNYRVEGVMVNGENVFDITGWREVSTERDEQEESLEFTAVNRATGMRMVFELENENESDETGMEFAYSIYGGSGRDSLIRSFEISFEQESGWMGEETEFELFTHENGQTMEYEIESEVVGGVEKIRITRRAGGPVERYRATRNDDGTYSYEYVGSGTRWDD